MLKNFLKKQTHKDCNCVSWPMSGLSVPLSPMLDSFLKASKFIGR